MELILLESIENDYTTYFAFMISGINRVFEYANGKKQVITFKEYENRLLSKEEK